MKFIAITIQFAVLVCSATWMILGLIDFFVWGFTRLSTFKSFYAFIEFPEKELIAICIASTAAAILITKVPQGLFWRRIRSSVFISAFSVGILTFLSKVAVSFYSEDNDIAQWHHLCVAISLLLLAIVSACASQSSYKTEQGAAANP
jgi:hypothetical protein